MVLGGTTACSHETVHRVLVFFLDGVPPPDAGMPDADVELPQAAGTGETVEPPGPSTVAPKIYYHPVYKDNRCGGCHVAEGGGLLKTAREGLCLSCHTENPPKKKFVHGPVAMSDCLACHTYHKSRYAKLLSADAQTVCFYCHAMGELTTDKHHATIEKERCVDCHDAHGGDDPFFLLSKANEQSPS